MLPDDLLLDVLERFPTRQLLQLGRVCRRFYWAATSLMRSRSGIDLQPCYDAVTDSALHYLAPKMSSVRALNLSWIGSCAPFDLVTGAGLMHVVRAVGENLTTLRLACCGIVTDAVLKDVCDICSNLEELDVQRCEGLTHAAFHHIGRLRNLERLNVYSTFINTAGLKSICAGCGPTLRHLDLGHCNHLQSPDALAPVATHCSSLVSLCVWFNRYASDSVMTKLAANCPLLEELDLGWCSSLSLPRIVQDLAALELKKLFLTANRTVDDRCLEVLASGCSALEQLDVLGSKGVTQDGVARVLGACENLYFLDISFCTSIPAEAVQMWRERYPKLTIKRSFSQRA